MAEWRGSLRLALLNEFRIEFHVNPDEPIIDLIPNRRYMAHFVEIPEEVAEETGDRRPVTESTRAPSAVATALCEDPQFHGWASEALFHEGRGRLPATKDTAWDLIRMRCGVHAFEQLDMDGVALKIFHERVELPFYRYRGAK